jgi:hypothetical protein
VLGFGEGLTRTDPGRWLLDFRAMEGEQIPGRYETPGGMLVDAGLEALLEENTHPIEVAVKVNASMINEEKLEINGVL